MSKSVLGRKPGKVPSDDGRSAERVLLRNTRRALAQHVGGSPTATQAVLIDRAAWLTLHLAMLDARAIKDGGLSDHAARQYLAWNNSLTRSMATLGIKPADRPRPQIGKAGIAAHLAGAP